MKTVYVFFCILICNCMLFAQSYNQFDKNGKRHGKWKKNYDNTDVLRYEGQFLHGKEVGLFKFYKNYKSKAVLSATKQFNPDHNVADVKFFTSAGKLVSEGQMEGKTYIGTWKYYQKNNDKLLILEYYNSQGELDGERFVYYPNGQVAEKQNYRNGKRHGASTWFSEDNVMLKSYVYANGELHGEAKFFNANGELITEGNYKKDKKSGVWRFYENGKLVKEDNY
ncbi:toxin-antitoxin system YwqK family antitoxin [Flavobacteriaceae bacterium GSB9]|nr:toxin-antitoxin system YwqK family antitoxin [Flavobacteriaceae bacterium GSB9]